jgi:phosphate butyryltransferase
MKGNLQTGDFMKAVLDKEHGLRKGDLLSHALVLETRKLKRLFIITDGGIVIQPTLEEKAAIIRNVIPLARALGIDCPLIAVLAAVEKVNPKMPETLDAEALVRMNREGALHACVIGGPFGLDNAISEEAAKLKGITDPVAGKANVLLVPNVVTGNIACKAVMYMADCAFGGIVLGASAPIVLLSRADDAETKLHSLVLGVIAAEVD